MISEEDFKSLGWGRKEDDDRAHHISFSNGVCDLYYCKEDNEIVIVMLHPKVINFDRTIFMGFIENIEELKVLMGFLDI